MAWAERHGAGFRGSYRDTTGRKRRTKTFSTKRAALQAANDEESKVRQGQWFDPLAGRTTFSEYFERGWLPNRGGEIRTKTEYESAYRSNLKEHFGHLQLRQILPSTVQGWVNRQVLAGDGPHVVRSRHKVLQTCLAARKGVSARRDRLIDINPCEGVQLPVLPERRVTILERGESDAIIAPLDPWWRVMPLLAAESGLRWGELLGLTVEDFKPLHCVLVVRRTIVEATIAQTGTGTRFAWKPYPKTRRVREVVVASHVVAALNTLIAERDLGPTDRLFSMPDREPPPQWHPPLKLVWTPLRTEQWPEGLPISARFHREAVWAPAVRATNSPERTFRDLRALWPDERLTAGRPQLGSSGQGTGPGVCFGHRSGEVGLQPGTSREGPDRPLGEANPTEDVSDDGAVSGGLCAR